MERILCAAIHFNDKIEYVHQPKNIKSGLVVCGRRHHNCFAIFAALKGQPEGRIGMDITQGFITDTDRFVDREEALQIALKAGQTTTTNSELFSEDLY